MEFHSGLRRMPPLCKQNAEPWFKFDGVYFNLLFQNWKHFVEAVVTLSSWNWIKTVRRINGSSILLWFPSSRENNNQFSFPGEKKDPPTQKVTAAQLPPSPCFMLPITIQKHRTALSTAGRVSRPVEIWFLQRPCFSLPAAQIPPQELPLISSSCVQSLHLEGRNSMEKKLLCNKHPSSE